MSIADRLSEMSEPPRGYEPWEIDEAGDSLLWALVMQTLALSRAGARPLAEVGDLVIETSSRSPDWERLGYLVRIEDEHTDDPCYHIYGVGKRVTRWRNAAIARVGHPRARLPGLTYPGGVE